MIKDKRCPVCREWFTPASGRQNICAGCRPYYYVSGGDCGPARSIEDARALYLADMREKKIKVSDWPAAPGCEGCIYWRSVTGGAVANCCHYYIDTHERRPCPPGRNCAVRINKKRKGERHENPIHDNHDNDLGLY